MKKFLINEDILKIIALLTMTLDHFCRFYPNWQFSEMGTLIGRISFPIFGYLLMMHLSQHQIYEKYLKRLGFFGFITFFIALPIQQIFDVPLAFSFNILITFWNVVAALYLYKIIEQTRLSRFFQYLLFLPILAAAGAFSVMTQYQFMGFCFLLSLYFYFEKRTYDWLVLSILFSGLINFQWDVAGGFISLMSGIFLLLFMEPASYPRLLKRWWIFYVYYPAHMIALALIAWYFKM